jgi:hypothetical protein
MASFFDWQGSARKAFSTFVTGGDASSLRVVVYKNLFLESGACFRQVIGSLNYGRKTS